MRRDEESVVLLETFDYRAFIGKHVLFSLNIEPELKGRITIGMVCIMELIRFLLVLLPAQRKVWQPSLC